MGKKLLDLNGAELMAAFVRLAAPIGRLVEDDELFEALMESSRDAIGAQAAKRSKLGGFLAAYARIVPKLLGEEHIRDTAEVFAVIEGKTVSELLEMNGAELMADVMRAWKEQLGPFLSRCTGTGKTA